MHICGFCNVWICVRVGVLVIRVFVNTGFLYCFVYVSLFLSALSVLVKGLLPQSDNSTTVNNNNNIHSCPKYT